MSKPSTPSPPDPYQSAAAQYQYGTAAANYNAALNHTNVITPYGSTTWSTQNPGTSVAPSYSASGSTPSFGLGGGGMPMQIQANPQAYQPFQGGTPFAGQTGGGAPSAYTAGNYGSAAQQGNSGGVVPNQQPPVYTQQISLSPEQQELLDLQQGNQIAAGQTSGRLASQVYQSLGSPIQGLQTGVQQTPVQTSINTNGVPGIVGQNNLDQFTNQAQNAAYQQQTQYLDPQFSQAKESLEAELTNQGSRPGDPAWNNAMTLFNNQQQQAYSNAQEQSVSEGLAEQQALYGESANTNQQLFGQQATSAGFANQAAGQQFGQNLAGAQFANTALQQQREIPLNEYLSLEGSTASGTPSFGLGGGGGGGGGVGGVQSPDILSAFNNQYQGQLAGYNANVASTNADIGAGASLIGSYLSYLALAAA